MLSVFVTAEVLMVFFIVTFCGVRRIKKTRQSMQQSTSYGRRKDKRWTATSRGQLRKMNGGDDNFRQELAAPADKRWQWQQ